MIPGDGAPTIVCVWAIRVHSSRFSLSESRSRPSRDRTAAI